MINMCAICTNDDDDLVSPMQPKFGGMVIDIVSREIRTPQQQAEALEAVKNTILAIILIVVTGYSPFLNSAI